MEVSQGEIVFPRFHLHPAGRRAGYVWGLLGVQAIDHLEDSMVDLPDLGTRILQRIGDPFAVAAWWCLRHERVRLRR